MKNKKNGLFGNSLFYIFMFVVIIAIVGWFVGNNNSQSQSQSVSSSQFVKDLQSKKVKSFSIQPANGVYKVNGVYQKAQKVKTDNSSFGLLSGKSDSSVTHFNTTILTSDSLVNQVNAVAKKNNVAINTNEESQSGMWISVLTMLLPMAFIAIFLYMMMGQAGQGGGGNGRVMNFGKSKAKPQDPKKNKVRFSDVAGAEEEKQELVEVVEFLKDPRKFASLGARIPAGVLLEGPPGTGKTLLARAVAGEAGVPFFSISGSDFVEMFVGVGASRVRDLFENAKKNAPSIIFIDEIDAVGRQRGAGLGGGHDEREQTLNQLLVEMDGFTGNEGVIVIAATNRSDVLDPALLRPGRFDRKILVGRPDVKGREAILKVHAKNKPFADDVDLKEIARQTPGFVGADLENLLNEAALVAARRSKKKIDASDIDEAEDRVIAGPAKKDRVIAPKERTMVAYHEAGHAIIGLVLSDSRVVRKVTIIPRGRAGGYAIMLPKDDQFLLTKKELDEQIAGLLGGRTAEEIIFGAESTGASNDFEQATQIARGMVTQYGMSPKLGTVALESGGQPFVGAEFGQNPGYSQQTATSIDDEVRRIIDEAHERARNIIETHRDQHKAIAEALLKYETLNEKQILSLFKTGKMPEGEDSDEFPSESAGTFEEAKKLAERKDAEKQVAEEAENAEAKSDADTKPADETKADAAKTDTADQPTTTKTAPDTPTDDQSAEKPAENKTPDSKDPDHHDPA
ncbi:ATP-dependent Zn protease [Agrilactobacillus composti DSM 18527 = JCM 14202]|uniref:ATP-dependent zinc metalloprotease FtsH n=1 Tax=Agrilactobacillus composti DSM 18527 = JCM 14202 TaxID=1423734 RepID=X0PE25_9LACO|nr:ATP-dependent zinc metalloprotease FtsH [Agrilactobacillus composti]KRM31516.1 ATP-dependent Zn protease [Agrilactobacillus composti DSM 18527 = JCM 14202]GAF39468.1 cell division protein FtsH [Agrilactobacillus composti DSM 18527 = JCM 14202]